MASGHFGTDRFHVLTEKFLEPAMSCWIRYVIPTAFIQLYKASVWLWSSIKKDELQDICVHASYGFYSEILKFIRLVR